MVLESKGLQKNSFDSQAVICDNALSKIFSVECYDAVYPPVLAPGKFSSISRIVRFSRPGLGLLYLLVKGGHLPLTLQNGGF